MCVCVCACVRVYVSDILAQSRFQFSASAVGKCRPLHLVHRARASPTPLPSSPLLPSLGQIEELKKSREDAEEELHKATSSIKAYKRECSNLRMQYNSLRMKVCGGLAIGALSELSQGCGLSHLCVHLC